MDRIWKSIASSSGLVPNFISQNPAVTVKTTKHTIRCQGLLGQRKQCFEKIVGSDGLGPFANG
jgi:hypothetical protein